MNYLILVCRNYVYLSTRTAVLASSCYSVIGAPERPKEQLDPKSI